jgi:hypothetical protein
MYFLLLIISNLYRKIKVAIEFMYSLATLDLALILYIGYDYDFIIMYKF